MTNKGAKRHEMQLCRNVAVHWNGFVHLSYDSNGDYFPSSKDYARKMSSHSNLCWYLGMGLSKYTCYPFWFEVYYKHSIIHIPIIRLTFEAKVLITIIFRYDNRGFSKIAFLKVETTVSGSGQDEYNFSLFGYLPLFIFAFKCLNIIKMIWLYSSVILSI